MGNVGRGVGLRSFRIVLFQERIEEGSDASASDHRNNFKLWILVAWALWFPQFNKLHPMAGSFILAMHATDHRFCSIRRIVGHASKREMVELILTISVNVLVLGALT